jgi:hypothetical protein
MTINNNNIFGAFTLGEVRSGRLTGDWLNKESVANYGWFGGGYNSIATVDRIDFSNDSSTASPRGSLSSGRHGLAATGNSNYGWFGGGVIPARSLSTVDRIDFSNDSSTASPRGPLSLARYGLAATGNSNYGWFGGGFPGPLSTVDRIDFSNDAATASPRGSLSLARYNLAATGNSNYGWFGGGNPGFTSTVDRIDLSNDSGTASPRGPLSSTRYSLAATGNSNYGWFGGGGPSSTPGPLSRVDRIDFSNDSSTASVRGPLTLERTRLAATGNSNYGWFGGGYNTVTRSTVDRIDFSNDSVSASLRGSLNPAGKTTHTATSGVLNIRRQKAGNYGWFGGGNSGPVPSPMYLTVDRIDFTNDLTTVSQRGPLSSARYNFAATGNSNYGWYGGGLIVSFPAYAPIDRVDRIDFSNDSATASIRSPLSTAKYNLAATGNSNYGWFGGGTYFFAPTPSGVNVDRINFSNDLATISSRLNFERVGLAATGNSNYGWFGGGFPGPSRVDRMNFSNDSISTSPRGPLSFGRGGLAATGNSNYGWFGGGVSPSPATLSTVDRIDFSNDSATASVRGPLSSARYNFAATGNSNYGWFGGGLNPSLPVLKSTVDRIDFSNDLSTVLTRQPLSTSKSGLAATSNTNK